MPPRAPLVRCSLCDAQFIPEALAGHVWSVHLADRSMTPRKAGDVIRRALAKIKLVRQHG